MNKIIFCLGIIGYSTLLWGMDPSISLGSSDLVSVRSISPNQIGNNQEQGQDRFFLIMRTLDGNEKRIDWKKLIPLSSVQNSEPELHPYNQQLKDVAERGFNRMIKDDGLDFTELERIVLENKLSFLVGFEDSMPIFEKLEAFRLRQKKIIEENKQLLEKNVDLERANKELRSNYREIDLEYRKLCDDYDGLFEVHEQLQKENETTHSELQTFIIKHQRLFDENNQLRALLEQTKQMVQTVGSEAQNLMEASQHPDEEKDFKFERMYEDLNAELSKSSNKPFNIVLPRLQNKSRLRLFCALFVTGGMLWGLKYFFNK